MRKHWGAAAVTPTVLAAALLSGCAAPTGEDAFVDRMKSDVRPPVDGKGQPTGYEGLVEIGHEICKDQGTAAEVEASWAAAGFRAEEAAALVEASVLTLCPDRKVWLDT